MWASTARPSSFARSKLWHRCLRCSAGRLSANSPSQSAGCQAALWTQRSLSRRSSWNCAVWPRFSVSTSLLHEVGPRPQAAGCPKRGKPTQERESAREESAQKNSGGKLELAIELEGLTDPTDSITDRFLQLTTDPTFSQDLDARDMKMKWAADFWMSSPSGPCASLLRRMRLPRRCSAEEKAGSSTGRRDELRGTSEKLIKPLAEALLDSGITKQSVEHTCNVDQVVWEQVAQAVQPLPAAERRRSGIRKRRQCFKKNSISTEDSDAARRKESRW